MLSAAILVAMFSISTASALSIQPGWPQTTSGIWRSAALVDLDLDGDLEIVAACYDGNVHAWHGDGTAVTGWPQSTGESPAYAATVGDLDEDGSPEVIATADLSVHAWRADGTPLPGWPRTMEEGDSPDFAPALGDLDGDGSPEVVVGTCCESGKVYAWHANGAAVTGWPQSVGKRVQGSPALGDLDGDRDPEVLVTGSVRDFSDYNVHAWHGDGRPVAGWPRSLDFGQSFCTPALGDLDGDGDVEVVAASNAEVSLYVWHANGRAMDGWPRELPGAIGGARSPVLGDLDGDGDLEIVVGTSYREVYAIHADGRVLAGWPQSVGEDDIEASPALGDLDGDGNPEVVVASWRGRVYAWRVDGTLLDGWPQRDSGLIDGSPVIGDLDGDGDLEVVIGDMGTDVAAPALHVWSCDTATSDYLPWPTFQHDRWHTGVYRYKNRFWDVPVGYWAWREIEACVVAGIVQGYPGGWYRPGWSVARDQMAVYAARALEGG